MEEDVIYSRGKEFINLGFNLRQGNFEMIPEPGGGFRGY